MLYDLGFDMRNPTGRRQNFATPVRMDPGNKFSQRICPDHLRL
jgi:hypothetical protein